MPSAVSARSFLRGVGLLSFLLLWSTGGVGAQTLLHGFDQTRLENIDAVLERYVAEERVAGAVAMVLRDGHVVYEGSAGWGDREAQREMETDAIFRIASQSKAITSALVMMLVEEGKVNLNEPISRWMPTFANHRVAVRNAEGEVEVVPATRAITVQDLLTHTAGISYGRGILESFYLPANLGDATAYAWYTADKNETVCETMDRLGTLPQAEHPGSAWVYGYNSDVLGCIVERVSGMPLDVFLRTRLTEPLGMTDTHFYLPTSTPRERLAAVYTIDGATGRIRRAEDGTRGQGNYIEGPRRNFAGGAGLLSTAQDYARFLEMTRNGGELDGVRYLSPASIRLMTSNQIGTLRGTGGLGFGLGFETVDRAGAGGFASVGSYGWSGAYGTYYKVDPARDLVMVLMLQVVPYVGSGIRESFDAAVYGALVD